MSHPKTITDAPMWMVCSGAISQVPSPPTTQITAVAASRPADAGEEDEEPEHQQRQGVGDQVVPAGVQQRREQDPEQALVVPGPDALVVEPVAEHVRRRTRSPRAAPRSRPAYGGRPGPARPALPRVGQAHRFTVRSLRGPADHPVLHAERVVVVVDLHRARGPAPSPARRSRRRSAHSSRASSRSMAARASDRRSSRQRPRSASNAAARSSRCPGAFSVRRALPLPTTRYDGSSRRRSRGSAEPRRAGARRPARPASSASTVTVRARATPTAVAAGRPQVGDRVLEARRTRGSSASAPGTRTTRRHWSPRIARRGGRRPAIDHTMSTTCRVSTTSWTR